MRWGRYWQDERRGYFGLRCLFFFFSREVPASILRCRWPLLPFSGSEGKGEDHVADYLSHGDQKIPYWLTKSTFLVKVQVTISLSIKTRFGVIGL